MQHGHRMVAITTVSGVEWKERSLHTDIITKGPRVQLREGVYKELTLQIPESIHMFWASGRPA